MDVAIKVIYNVALLFVMMVPGFLMKKCRLCDERFGKGLSNLVLYIAQPALTLLAYLRPYDENIMVNALYVFGFSVVLHGIFAGVAMLFFKKAPDSRRRMLRFATIFSNAAFMGIPLIAVVLEPEYLGATLYATIYNITFNLFLWSLGAWICTNGRDENTNGVDDFHDKKKVSILTALTHPTTIASVIGLAFLLLQNPIPQLKIMIPEVLADQELTVANALPKILVEALTMLKGLVAPLSMAVIGLRLADMSFNGMLRDVEMYIFIVLRHIALPLISVGIVKLVGLVVPLNPAVEMVTVILAAAPAASSATMFAEKFDCDAVYVSRLVTVSTVISIVTIPLILLLV